MVHVWQIFNPELTEARDALAEIGKFLAAAARPQRLGGGMTAPAAEGGGALRAAELRDVAPIVQLIRELAEFERLEHLRQVSAERLRPHLFGERPVAEAMVAEVDGEVIAFALYFTNFSTFLAQPGLYLEDPYALRPAHRGSGIGEAMLRRLAALAVERNYGRFEWSVLDWNSNAIRFYQRPAPNCRDRLADLPRDRPSRSPRWLKSGAGDAARTRQRGDRPLRGAARRLSLARPRTFNIAQACCGRWARATPDNGDHRRPRRWRRAAALHLRSSRRWPTGCATRSSAWVARGDRVAIVMPQRRDGAAHIAAYRIGAVAMPLSMLFGPTRSEYRLNDSQAVLAIADESRSRPCAPCAVRCPALRTLLAVGDAQARATSTGMPRCAASRADFAHRPRRRRRARGPHLHQRHDRPAQGGALIPHRALIGNPPGFCLQPELVRLRSFQSAPFPGKGERGKGARGQRPVRGAQTTPKRVLEPRGLGLDRRPDGRAAAHAVLRPPHRRQPGALRPDRRPSN